MTKAGNTAAERLERLRAGAEYLKERLGSRRPEIGLILGSGLGDLAEQLEDAVYIPYEDVPFLPRSTVEGHAGRFAAGRLEDRDVLAMQGRFHYYEGYSMQQVVAPVYLMKLLGIADLVITNAAGGMNASFEPGDLMLISDHLNWTGTNPLIGENVPELGVRFPDMSEAYSKSHRELAKRLAAELNEREQLGLNLREGVYAGVAGPTYMTPSELIMLRNLGGDAVGMSTVGEVIAARHAGISVLGISCITDMAIGEHLEPLTHEQVMETANRTKPKFQRLVREFVKRIGGG